MGLVEIIGTWVCVCSIDHLIDIDIFVTLNLILQIELRFVNYENIARQYLILVGQLVSYNMVTCKDIILGCSFFPYFLNHSERGLHIHNDRDGHLLHVPC